MNTIIFGKFNDNRIDEEISAYPNFLFNEFKLVFDVDFCGRVETIVKICEPSIEENDYRGTIRLIDYSDNYNDRGEYEMEYRSEDGVNFVYACCDGDNYDRGYAVDSILREILYLISKRERTQKNVEVGAKDTHRKEILHKKRIPSNKVFLLSDICEYFYIGKNPNKESHTITCPCWNVRGHYRHYKNGKVVFIKNYEKGKRKGQKAKDKTYVV